jgi:hypothetical protein
MSHECTIGWIKTEKGALFFKNRDTNEKYLKTNLLKKEKMFIKFGYLDRKGCWIGINKYGIGFASSEGPYRKIPVGYFSWKKFNEVGEFVLKKSKSLREAVELFIKVYRKHRIGASANILLCDNQRAHLLEICLDKINDKVYSNLVFKTNHFERLEEFNSYLPSLEVSELRLKKFKKIFKETKPKNGKELIHLLTYHSRNAKENVCRHGKIMTVGSVIFEILPHSIICRYSLNSSPCKKKYKFLKIQMKK